MTQQIAKTEKDAAGFLKRVIKGFWIAPTLAVAIQLRLPDLLAEGPRTLEALADATATDGPSLRRLLNALASEGVFERFEDGRYGPTAVSTLIRADHPSALAHLINTGMYGENFAAWTQLEQALRAGACAFDLEHGVNWVDYMRTRPARRDVFAAGMTATTHASEAAVFNAHDFGAFDLAVDVGGNHASLIGRLLERHPRARGVVFDLPETVEAGRAHWRDKPFASRLTAVGGDFFAAVPVGDLYLLKMILHDWSDEDSVRILRSVRRAIQPGGRVTLIETVLPPDSSPSGGWGLDIAMMVTTGGRERTLAEFAALLATAGFEVTRHTPTRSIYGVIEARPV